jgi:hypothetical protein
LIGATTIKNKNMNRRHVRMKTTDGIASNKLGHNLRKGNNTMLPTPQDL